MKKGIIEGFYGTPWTFEERKSMINFLSDIGLNQYIYAPKDDPYHNKKWREAYPPEEISKIKDLADLSCEKNIEFTWAIHPGQNPFDFDNYDEEIDRIYAKYEALIAIGVKSFGLCMDDIDKKIAFNRRFDHMKLIKDLADFISAKTGNNLYFVHPWYNDDWIDEKGYEYEKLLKDIGNINIMWTGKQVVAPISHKSNEEFAKRNGKKPYIWFNWPVNDYRPDEIFVEKFEFFDSKDLNFGGFYLNPMNEAEASKTSIYQAAKLLENPENYRAEEAFEKALKYLEPTAWKELVEISPSFYGSLVYERSLNKKFTEDMEIKSAYEEKNHEALKNLLERKIKAIVSYQENHSNKELNKELSPFMESLKLLAEALLSKIDGDLSGGEMLYEKSKTIKIQVLGEKGMDQIRVKTSRIMDEIYKNLEI